jgi:hypothetical protein
MSRKDLLSILAALAMFGATVARADDNFNLPDVVRFESAHLVGDDLLVVAMASTRTRYSLICITKNAGCITPTPNKNYLLFDKRARYMMPGAKEFLTLKFVQGWVGAYTASDDNIGLVPEEGGAPASLGIFVLESRKAR